jgi:hypothetical protein
MNCFLVVCCGELALMRGTSLKPWHRAVNVVLRTVYYGRVPVLDLSGADAGDGATAAHPPVGRRPRLIVASHRNGAFDGQQVLAAFPRTQFLVSIQLLRHRFLRLFVAGIQVVRPKDVQRYGLDPTSVAGPVGAGCEHLRRGGDLGIFPEGSSAWGYRPQKYHRGAARIACTLVDEGLDLELVPVGLFYSTPDRFRSRAQVVRGPSVSLPPRDGQDRRAWETQVATTLAQALDRVSVNCPDQVTFDRVQAQALQAARTSTPRRAGTRAVFAQAFLRGQQDDATPVAPRRYTAWRWLGLALMWLFAPVLAVAWFAGTKADARNTVTFFRLLGGAGAALFWVPTLIVAAVFWPVVVGVGLLSALLGWLLLGARRIRL